MDVLVEIRGGVLQGVYTDLQVGALTVYLADYDVEGVEEASLSVDERGRRCLYSVATVEYCLNACDHARAALQAPRLVP